MIRMAIQHAKDSNFAELVKPEGITVVNFWASWCGPCRMFAPLLEKFEKEAGPAVSVIKVNVDEGPVTSSQYQIMGIPSTIIFKDGVPQQSEVGILPINTLHQLSRG
jgi:thioredoxin 1